MNLPSSAKLIYQRSMHILCVGVIFTLAACSQHTTQPQVQSQTPPQMTTEQAETVAEPAVRYKPIPAESVYPLLVAEFALRREQLKLALGTYLEQAHTTKDLDITRHTTKLANYLKADNATLDSALLWTEIEPNNAEPHILAAVILSRQNQPRAALNQLLEIEKLGETPDFSLIISSALNLADGERAELLLDINELLKTRPNNAELLLSKALLEQRSGLINESLLTVQNALNIKPNNLNALTLETKLLLQLNRKNQAFTRFERQLDANPNNQAMRVRYARLLSTIDLNKAQIQFETLARQRPNDADITFYLALIFYENEQISEAQTQLYKLLTLNKRTNQAHYYLGRIAEQNEDDHLALTHYQAVGNSLEYINAVRGQLRIHLRNKEPEKAVKLLVRARVVQQAHAERFYLLQAELHNQLQDWEQSVNILNEAIARYPDNHSLIYARAMVQQELGHIELLEKDLRLIIASDPQNSLALNALGYTLADKTDRLDEALELITKALTLNPNEPAILDSMGWVQYRLGNLNAASDYLKRALAQFPDHEVAAHYGEVLWHTDQQEAAKQVWQKALNANPYSTPIKETLKRLNISLPQHNAENSPKTGTP